MDVSQLEAALTPRTRMVVAVSILGNPAALDVMRRVLRRARPLSSSRTTASRWAPASNGRLCGTFGDIGTFSTFYSHHISTMEGGLLVTNDTELAHLARAIRNHGWARDLPRRHADRRRRAIGRLLRGVPVHPARLQRAAARDVRRGRLEQLKKLDAMLETRRRQRRAVRRAVRRRRALHPPARARPQLVVQLHDHPEPGAAASIAAGSWRRCARGGIGFRMITGGCFLRHEAAKFFDYETVGEHRERQHRPRPRLLRRQPPARPDGRDHAPARGARRARGPSRRTATRSR